MSRKHRPRPAPQEHLEETVSTTTPPPRRPPWLLAAWLLAAFAISFSAVFAWMNQSTTAPSPNPRNPPPPPPTRAWPGSPAAPSGWATQRPQHARRPALTPRHARRLLDGQNRGHQRPVRTLRRGNRLCDRRRTEARPEEIFAIPRAAGRPPRPRALLPGSLVFTPPDHEVPLENHYVWWSYSPGADWRHPEGPDSSIEGKDNTPSSRSAGTTPSPTPNGPANASPPRPNGNTPPAAVSTANATPGATSSTPEAAGWSTTGRAASPGKTPRKTVPNHRPRRHLPRQRLRPLRHGRKRLGMVLRLVPPRLLPRKPHQKPQRPLQQLRPQRAQPPQARPERRLLPL